MSDWRHLLVDRREGMIIEVHISVPHTVHDVGLHNLPVSVLQVGGVVVVHLEGCSCVLIVDGIAVVVGVACAGRWNVVVGLVGNRGVAKCR